MGAEFCPLCVHWPGSKYIVCPATYEQPSRLWASNCGAFQRKEQDESVRLPVLSRDEQ